MEKNKSAIIEIGSNNTKTHVYENDNLIYDNNITIRFKENYYKENRIEKEDLEMLFKVIEKTKEFTNNILLIGCSIFRNISEEELNNINKTIKEKYDLQIKVVSQEDESYYTALGCYNDIEYKGNICIFVGGGGSIELVFVNNKEIIDKKYYDFGVVDITKQFESLKEDIPTCTFDEAYSYVSKLIGDIDIKADVLILSGGNHLYWYNNAKYELMENKLYKSKKQKYMITKEISDQYDRDALLTSLDTIRNNSNNPVWFDYSRAMKIATNVVSDKIDAKYIVPTSINMEDGLRISNK